MVEMGMSKRGKQDSSTSSCAHHNCFNKSSWLREITVCHLQPSSCQSPSFVLAGVLARCRSCSPSFVLTIVRARRRCPCCRERKEKKTAAVRYRSLPLTVGDPILSLSLPLSPKPLLSDEGAGAVGNSAGMQLDVFEGDSIVEPHEGMEFESEDAAKMFYDEYARRVGFVMRVMSCRRSERDGRILARRFGCNKEGYCFSIRGKFGPVRKPRPSTREGCKAMIHVKFDKSRKWMITKFVKEHNHELVVCPREARQMMDEKDKKIQELTAELQNKKRLCAAYQEQLTAFMKVVEEHSDQLSKKVKRVVLGEVCEGLVGQRRLCF